MQTNHLYRVDGLSVVVTGAGSGIGRSCAIAMAESGASKIYITGRRRELLVDTAEFINKQVSNCDVIAIDGDVTSIEWRQKFVREISSFGPLDILVNNAGIYHSTSFENTSDDELQQILKTNVESVFALTRDLLPALEQSNYPSVINIGSTLSLRPIAQGSAYNIAKAAIDHLTKSLAVELGSRRIRVNCVSPGIVETPMYRARFPSDESYYEAIEEAKVWHPLGRVGTPEDIARSVVFLSSRAASWITGIILPVDGGLLIS
ncbi:MAG TPA: 3-oxoacyl-ACP reductase [Bacteroidetes bacterium]|nr:3-oxoacyl-ACP reductase [Bacteroidota bacterium]